MIYKNPFKVGDKVTLVAKYLDKHYKENSYLIMDVEGQKVLVSGTSIWFHHTNFELISCRNFASTPVEPVIKFQPVKVVYNKKEALSIGSLVKNLGFKLHSEFEYIHCYADNATHICFNPNGCGADIYLIVVGNIHESKDYPVVSFKDFLKAIIDYKAPEPKETWEILYVEDSTQETLKLEKSNMGRIIISGEWAFNEKKAQTIRDFLK